MGDVEVVYENTITPFSNEGNRRISQDRWDVVGDGRDLTKGVKSARA